MKNFINAAKDFFTSEGETSKPSNFSAPTANTPPPYSLGYSDYVIDAIKQRTVEMYANFLLPYLKSNMVLLDCGCGPGSISIGFAKKLNDGGKVVGIDMEPTQLKIATAAATAAGVDNVSFQQANIMHLPFEDETFDVVYTSAVLQHLHDPLLALKEMLRVVKSGGIIAVTEPDHAAMVFYPELPLAIEAKLSREKVFFRNGINPKIGRKLRYLFMQAGCKNVLASINSFCCADNDSISLVCEYLAKEWSEALYGKKALADGTVSAEQIQSYQQAWRNLAKVDYAFITFTWGIALGWKK